MAGLAAGVLNILVELLPKRWGFPLDLVVNILGLWVLAALYLRQREASGRLGLVGYAVKSFGLALVIGFLFTEAFVLTDFDAAQRAALLAGPAGLAAVTGLALLVLGAVLFGLASLRAGVLPRGGVLLLMTGFVILPLGAVAPALVKTASEVVLSAGLVWLSLALIQTASLAPSAARPI
jgi:hypothetical protein